MAGRRGWGEGSIFEDPERGGYVVLVRWDGGRRKARARTKTEARAKMTAIRAEIAANGRPGDGNRTVGQLAEEWGRKVLGAREHAPATIESYHWALRVIDREYGSTRVRALSADGVEEGLARLAKAGLTRATLVKIRSVLGQILAWGERRGVVHRNVARIAEIPVGAKRPAVGRSLTADQARQLLVAADDDRLAGLWATMLLLGLRPGEATGLLWDDIDFEVGRIHVRRSLKWRKGAPVLDEVLKTSRSRRSLDAPEALLRRLRQQRRRQAEERLVAGARWSTNWPLAFTTTLGTPLDPANVRRAFSAVTEAADIGAWRPYDLRHSAASLLSASGVPLERIADVLGHDGIRMTALVYRHAVLPSVDAAVPVMDELFA